MASFSVVSMRVAIVTESFLPQINGVTNSVLRVLETFKELGFEAIVIAPTTINKSHLGFEVFTAPNIPVVQFPVAMPNAKLGSILREFNPDVIHVAAPFLLGAKAIKWGAKNLVPTVAVYQTDVAGYLERYGLGFARSAFAQLVASFHHGATLNLAPTELAADYLRSLGLDKVRVWGRGVDLELFNPHNALLKQAQDFRREHAPEGEILVGFVGRLALEKQVQRMAGLFGVPGVSFVVVGDGPERKRLETLFAGQPVKFTGALNGLELACAYAALDVFVHFGTEETFGQTIQEALASGNLVVAPNRGGPTQLIEHGKNGILVDPNEPAGYREVLEDLVAGNLDKEQFSKLAVQSVQGRSWAANNAKLVGYYLEAAQVVGASRVEHIELV